MAISKTVAVTLACVLGLPLARVTNATDAELVKIKANLLAYLTGAEADRKDTAVLDSLKDIEHSARKALTSMRPDGGWGDIDYTAGPDQEARLSRHLVRVEALARGFAVPGQSLAVGIGIGIAVGIGIQNKVSRRTRKSAPGRNRYRLRSRFRY